MTYYPFHTSGQVTLSGGAGTLRFAPAGESWEVDTITVATSTRILEAQVKVYRDYINDQYLVDLTRAGSSGDTSDTKHHLTDGECLYVVWSGGDNGAIATATLRGVRTVGNEGFRARAF